MGRPKGLPKTGGRQKGSSNKLNSLKSQTIEKISSKYQHDPLEALFEIAYDKAQPIELRVSVLKEITQYLYPKKKSVELTGQIEFNPQIEVYLPDNGTSET